LAYDEKGSLEIDQELPYQRRAWQRQRVMWVLLTLVLLAALLGLFGPGLLSDAHAGDTSAPLWLEYPRFAHTYADADTLRFQVAPAAVNAGQVRLWVSRDYLERVEVRRIEPEPEAVETTGDRYIYVFRAPNLNAPTRILFHVEPNSFGRLKGRAGLDGGAEFDFSQYVYP
jgi:hypothetical protein